jgi:serine/threonine-protein kinase
MLDSVVMKALEKKPDNRYSTAKGLLQALEDWKPAFTESPHKSKTLSSEPSKAALGMLSPADEGLANDLARRAFKARQAGRLAEAADLMEEAFNKSPETRHKYAHQVKLWRCGISM